jgi:hypothetical protein
MVRYSAKIERSMRRALLDAVAVAHGDAGPPTEGRVFVAIGVKIPSGVEEERYLKSPVSLDVSAPNNQPRFTAAIAAWDRGIPSGWTRDDV